MSKHILVCLPISAEQRARIEAVQGFAYRFTTPDTATVEDALWADAVLGNLPVPLIRQNDHLEWFQSNAAGPNNYLEPGVLPEKCIVTNATGAYGLAISECMLAMWLSLLKELPTYRDNQREHRWAPTGHSVGSIAGSQVLCVGMGDIGSNFARRAHALGAEVVGVRRTVHPDTPCPDYCTRVVAQSALDAELPQADLVALSLPGTPETLHLFNAERLALCKPGAILLNVGRGTAVDGEALAAAVHSGRLSGAGLDVTDPEPLPPEHPLWAEPNVIITPHVTGGFSLPKTLDNIVDIFAHNLKRYAAGQPLDNQMDRRTQYASGARLQSTLQKQKLPHNCAAVFAFVGLQHHCACARQASMAVKMASLVMVEPVMASTPAVEPVCVSCADSVSAALPPSSGVSAEASTCTAVTLPPVTVTVTVTSLRQPCAEEV